MAEDIMIKVGPVGKMLSWISPNLRRTYENQNVMTRDINEQLARSRALRQQPSPELMKIMDEDTLTDILEYKKIEKRN